MQKHFKGDTGRRQEIWRGYEGKEEGSLEIVMILILRENVIWLPFNQGVRDLMFFSTTVSKDFLFSG